MNNMPEKETFREYCYGKHIMHCISRDLPLEVFLSLLGEWKETGEDFLWFLNQKGVLIQTKEQFLDQEYLNETYLCGILSEDEMLTWVSLEHPDNNTVEVTMAYADAKSLLESCVEHGVLQEERAVIVVSVHKGNMVSQAMRMDDCIQSIMHSKEGQDVLIDALAEKGIVFKRRLDFLLKH